MTKKETQQNIQTKTMLYTIVFQSIYVKFFVIALFALLLLQPVAPALASLDTDIETDTTSYLEPTEVVYDEPEAQSQDDAVFVAQEEIREVAKLEDSTGVSHDIDPQTESLAEVVLTASSTNQSETELELITDGENSTSTSTSTSTNPTGGDETVDKENASTTPTDVIVVDEETATTSVPKVTPIPTFATTTATTTVDASTTVEQPIIVEHNSSAYQFNRDECAVVGSGTFYCSSTEDSPDLLKDGVFSAPDNDGDLEIYIRIDGEENKLTSNTVDDTAPYYDALSERIVWHSYVQDRYQIVSYDTKTNEQTYLTNAQYNNMEPVAYGDMTLWQAWVDNNWEIMMSDGNVVTQLTHNTIQDVSPHMRGGYVVWQTQFKDGWKVAVFDVETKAIEYIESEGGLIENPRFVLVYDSTNKEGDVQTVGYDFDNKVTFALGSLPKELPDELPNPDQTGETRALIQNKQLTREGENEVIDIFTPNSNNTSSSTSEFGTLDLSQGTSTLHATSTSTAEIVDIVIPQYTSTSTQSQDILPIDDLVIPPSIGTTTVEVR